VITELAASYTLAGHVEGLHVVKLNRMELPDVLLISLRYAKVRLGCLFSESMPRVVRWLSERRTPWVLLQAVLACFEPEAAELAILDLYAFEHDAIGVGSGVRAEQPDVERAGGESPPPSNTPVFRRL
jgi:hypothetical protein